MQQYEVKVTKIKDLSGVKEEFVIPPGLVPSCHAPSICQLSTGEILVCCYSGLREGSPDSVIIGRRFNPHRNKWSLPEIWVNVPQRAPANPRLFIGPDGVLWLLVGINYGKWCSGDTYLFLKRSFDNGKTWTDLELFLPVRGLLGRNKPLHFKNLWIIPVERERSWSATFIRSEDGGKSWQIVGDLGKSANVRVIQPALVMLDDGKLVAYMRSQEGYVFSSCSEDLGKTWSIPQPTPLPNNNSGLDVHYIKQFGLLVLAYNPVGLAASPDLITEQWPSPLPTGFVRWGPRTPLVLDFSSDGGRTWRWRIILEEGEGEYSYPYIIEAIDGSLHIVYTFNRIAIKHVVIPLNIILYLCGS